MTKSNRVEALINHYGNGKPGNLAKYLGVTPSTISSWKARDTFDMELVFAKCKNISPYWLLSGEGEMLLPNSHSDMPSTNLSSVPVVSIDSNIPSDAIETRPRIPFDAAAGSLSVAISPVSANQCEQIPLIQAFSHYDFTIIARGDSMTPDFISGDELACAFVSESTFIQWGRPHVLDTAQGIVLKKIFNDQDCILCRSINQDYPDFKIPKEEIYHIALVVGLIRHF